jgi:tetratricopeptide (TPR) repeat protein
MGYNFLDFRFLRVGHVPGDSSMSKDPLEALCNKAQQMLKQGQYQEARQIYQQALGYRSDSPEIHYGIATACFLVGDLHSAVYHFKEVIRIDPVRTGAYINLGAVYNRLEQYDDALATLRRGIQLDANRSEGYYNLGLVYKQLGQLDMAVNAYREAFRLNPRMYDAHFNLGNIFMEKGNLKQAIVHYSYALDIRPNWEKGRRALEAAQVAQNEQISLEKGEAEKAERASEVLRARAIPLDPNRSIDPEEHGKYLRELHRLVTETDSGSQEMLDFVQKEVEGVIRDLSICILTPNSPGHNLKDQIDRFDSVLTQLKHLQSELQKRIHQVQHISEEAMRH